MTWQELYLRQIPFRLNRSDLPTEFIVEMCAETADFYGPQVFYPAEVTDTSITTQPGQQSYKLPNGFQKLNFLRVLYNGVWIPVTIPDRYNEILEADVLQPPFTSLPVTLGRVYGRQLRLFPTPNGQYPVELTMESTIGIPTDDDDDTNFWVCDGRMLMIAGTLLRICEEYLDLELPQSPRIEKLQRATEKYLETLMSQSLNRDGPFIIRQNL
jgi:hypothetical protein